MNDQVFREKSLKQISNVDELHDYMRVTSPRVWMFLSVIMALIVGIIVYACTITMENTIQTKAAIYNGKEDGEVVFTDIELEIPPDMADVVKPGMEVRIGKYTGEISSVYTDEESSGALVLLDDDSVILPDGTYDSTIIIERVSPVSFLFN